MPVVRPRPSRPSSHSARRRLAAGIAIATTATLALFGAVPAVADPGSFAVAGIPSVPGAAFVGQPLTVSFAGMDIEPTPVTVAVDWYWSDGTPVASDDRIDLVYVPTAADVGKSLFGYVWLDTPGYQTYAVPTNLTGAAAIPGFDTVPELTVTGSGVVGEPLTVSESAGSWSPTPDALSYAWHRYPVDAVVASGTGPSFATYTPTGDDLGSTLYVVVTATKTDTAPNTQTSAGSTTVHLGSFTNVGRPTVSGSGLLGSPFTAVFDPAGTTPAPTSVTFQWFHTDGTPVAGATSDTFTPTADLVGQPLYVQATLRADGYQDYLTLGSDYTRTVSLRSFTAGAAPVVTGRNVLTGSLTAGLDDSGWSPRPASLTYQWFRGDGTPIAGATAATLLPTAELVGSSVYVVVTAHADGYQPYEAASAPTGNIAAPGIDSSTPAAVVGDTVTIELWGLLLDTDYTLELHSDPVALGTVRSSAEGVIRTTVTIPAGTPAGEHRIVVLLDGVEVAAVPITVAAVLATAPAAVATPAGARLAATGADDVQGLLALVALCLALGVAAVRVSGLLRPVRVARRRS